jgi:hypothetical protein
MLAAQHLVGRITDSGALRAAVRLTGRRRVADWVFGHYLAITPPGRVPRPRPPAPARAGAQDRGAPTALPI